MPRAIKQVKGFGDGLTRFFAPDGAVPPRLHRPDQRWRLNGQVKALWMTNRIPARGEQIPPTSAPAPVWNLTVGGSTFQWGKFRGRHRLNADEHRRNSLSMHAGDAVYKFMGFVFLAYCWAYFVFVRIQVANDESIYWFPSFW
eukprot:NODE_2413_length_576_cov_64.739421_g2363_i0.p1 GENE.NODE_2413_length_576_cov_64.739421_g2363_i0~~NODE_2413_length_576_cov_64.739421_g2363_i0.p1  ORF type:complete len:143 (+),score=22.65 NODE_2413_length_576_cov_64.739421_g2363_i0:58-486(+)